tara:strand:- start:19622 stop:20902 length:1281 start_codon:yes stop_codon:yes gene_type:complete
MKILTIISRILVGSLFIVSGLIKANDSLGFSYKLVEYFEPGVLDLEFLIPLALPLAIFISVFEIVLGFMVLFGAKMKLGSWLLLLMILFFTWLTFYSAYFDKVTECGCFGDAIKLTPWQSFTKDIVLLVFIVFIFFRRKSIEINTIRQSQVILPLSALLISLFSILMLEWAWIIFFFIFVSLNALLAQNFLKGNMKEIGIIGASKVFSFALVVYTLMYLPIRDFRPYAVGKSITEGMKSAEEMGLKAPTFATDFKLKNKVTGEEKIFSSVEYSAQKLYTDWDFIESLNNSYKVEDGYEPPIHDFILQNVEGEDLTTQILSESKVLALVCYDLEKANLDAIKKFETQKQALEAKGVKCYIFTASVEDEMEKVKAETGTSIPFISADGITLKTIVRSNPGFVSIKQGVVADKWSHRTARNSEEILSVF